MNSINNRIQDLLPRPKIDPFRTHHHPYYILTFGYKQESAGFRVLYYLCHILNECGYEAYVVDEKPVNGLRTPILTYEIYRRHKAEGRHSIAVYNEAIQGNPLNGDIVVRWIMNKKGYADDKMINYSLDDLMYYWSGFYAKNEEDVIFLNLPVIDRNIFNMDGVNYESRSGFCYYAHKYLNYKNGQAQLPEAITKNGTSLCQDIKRTHAEIADVLRHSKALYCYESSAIVVEAELCGCPAIIVKTDYLDGFNVNQLGFSLPLVTEDEIDFDYIPNHNDEYNAWYNANENKSWKTVGTFITQTQNAAQKYKPIQGKENPFIDFCQKNNDALYIYGTGDVSWNCYRLMSIWKISIKGFVISDNYAQTDTYKKTHFGLPVFCLSEMEVQNNSCALILAMIASNQNEVIKTLNKRGFENYIVY